MINNQQGYIKLSTSSPKFKDPIKLILRMGKNFYVEKMARLGFPK